MRKLTLAVLAAAFALLSCRTTINPVKKPKEPEVYIVNGGCTVRFYEATSDLPEGSKSVGRITVPVAETEDDTYSRLREKACELGATAISSLSWAKSSTETTAQRTELSADAWQLP